jgi:transposase-like protein
MEEQVPAPNYTRRRFPPEIIPYRVWLYVRFALNYRNVAALLAERSVVPYETVPPSCRNVDRANANERRLGPARPGDKQPSWPSTPSRLVSWQSGR